jgi:hypothetical protein
MWWKLSFRAHEIVRNGQQDEEIFELVDEANVLAEYTDWPRLRKAALGCAVLTTALIPIEASAALLSAVL